MYLKAISPWFVCFVTKSVCIIHNKMEIDTAIMILLKPQYQWLRGLWSSLMEQRKLSVLLHNLEWSYGHEIRAFATKGKKKNCPCICFQLFVVANYISFFFSFLFEACSDSQVGFNSCMSVCMSMLCACLILNPVGNIGSRIARSLCT